VDADTGGIQHCMGLALETSNGGDSEFVVFTESVVDSGGGQSGLSQVGGLGAEPRSFWLEDSEGKLGGGTLLASESLSESVEEVINLGNGGSLFDGPIFEGGVGAEIDFQFFTHSIVVEGVSLVTVLALVLEVDFLDYVTIDILFEFLASGLVYFSIGENKSESGTAFSALIEGLSFDIAVGNEFTIVDMEVVILEVAVKGSESWFTGGTIDSQS